MWASRPSWPAGSGCSTSVTPASAQAARFCSRLASVQASLASTMSSELGAALRTAAIRNPSPSPPSLILRSRRCAALAVAAAIVSGVAERDRIGGDAGAGRGAAEPIPDAVAMLLGFEVEQGAVERVAGGAKAASPPATPAGQSDASKSAGRWHPSCQGLPQASPPASRHNADRARTRRDRSYRHGATSATTTTASVLAPRLMVKLPSIGQCSILASSVGTLLEVILISRLFLDTELPALC